MIRAPLKMNGVAAWYHFLNSGQFFAFDLLFVLRDVEDWLEDENMKDEIENENAGGLAAISVHTAANPEVWQPELLEKGRVVHGPKSGQPLPEDAVREARGREIGLMADHGMCTRSAARGKLVRAKWLDDWGKNGMRSRLVAQQFNWAEREDVTQNTPPVVAARLLVSKASSFEHKVGPAAQCLAGWDCSVAFYHAPA